MNIFSKFWSCPTQSTFLNIVFEKSLIFFNYFNELTPLVSHLAGRGLGRPTDSSVQLMDLVLQ